MPAPMRYFPVEVDVRGRDALVVGTGREVLPKVQRLIDAGAKVMVVAREAPASEVVELAARGDLQLFIRGPVDSDLEGKAIVFVSTEEAELGQRWYADAVRAGRLLCTLDRPLISTFVNAAVVSVSGMTLTFGTEGKSPGVARRIREDLETLFSDPRLERFLYTMGGLRAALPPGERSTKMVEAVKGFAIQARLRFPAWFEQGVDP